MITVDDLSLQYSGAPLFSKVNLSLPPATAMASSAPTAPANPRS